jgi:hypothetical protein
MFCDNAGLFEALLPLVTLILVFGIGLGIGLFARGQS